MSNSESSSSVDWYQLPQYYKPKAKVYGLHTPYKCTAPKTKWISMYLNNKNLKFKSDIIEYYRICKLQQWGYI